YPAGRRGPPFRMSQLLKIDNIMYFVSDLERSADFYERALGLRRAWTDEERGMVGFLLPSGDSEVVLHTDPSIPNPDFSFLVENVEEFCGEYVGLGHRILRQPFDVRCGKFAVLADPDGNPIPIVDLTKFGN